MRQEYKDLIVWQRAMELVVEVYALTAKFPSDEKYNLASQMKRAAVSIPSNIAEGKLRGYDQDYQRFLSHAFGSGGELETQLEVVKRLPHLAHIDTSAPEALLSEVMKMLNTLLSKSSN
jgi:four helix bundle protein